MSECSTSVNTEVRNTDQQNTSPACANSSKKADICPLQHENDEQENRQRDLNCLQDVDEEEDEDEDVDFNPLLREAHSLEASSSLSSDVEDLDINVADSGENLSAAVVKNSKEAGDNVQDGHPNGDFEHGEDVVMQTTVSSGEVCDKNSNTTYAAITGRSSALITQSENLLLCDKENELTSLTDVSNAASSRKAGVDMDSEGAIWMRTRARYSLASFTMDELETFLQETDDEDDLQNVDDEEEYRKFLAAVLLGNDSENFQGNVNADDEDEENDADFELELEEALESEPDDIEDRRTPRRNRRQKASRECSKKLSEQPNRPLRPLLPFEAVGTLSTLDENKPLPNSAPSSMLLVNNGFTYGFTPPQIGQLHCLIHEHVQLLIQIFSVSVLDPAKGHIAATVKELISEMLKKRDQVLTWRTVPHPSFCFFPPYINPSVSDEFHKMLPPHDSNTVQEHFPSGTIREPQSNILPVSDGSSKHLSYENSGSFQNLEHTSWMPYIRGPVLSVTDVAPLRLAGQYIDDVASVVQAYKRHQIEFGLEANSEKEPLFPLRISPCSVESDGQGEIETSPEASNGMHCSPSNNHKVKKTMAATLVEKAKRQSVALVPKEIAKLAQRFWPLFNPALYPHKPPPAPIANRVLFTDAEDELLALGLMEYNSDWKAIQQRFLPCKSKHQIFVRQKNRTSSKAPENPIKAVRRLKNSPLSSEEIARIEAGLKRFKLDWISIWRVLVPYRDPSLLPRQWRIACGTQKSYKSDEIKKAKRRLYDSRIKASKTSSSTLHSPSGKEGDGVDNSIREANSGDDHMDKQDEAYVHEAFLSDWRPDNNVSSSCPANRPSQVGFQAGKQKENSVSGDFQPQTCAKSPQIVFRPYRGRRPNPARLVKLAPDLPPVNLPPSVRVISQSAFRNCHTDVSTKVPGNASRIGGMVVENGAQKVRSTPNSEVNYPVKSGHRSISSKVTANHEPRKHSEASMDKGVAEERDNSDLQMHPLFLQTLQDGRLPYYPPKYSTTSSASKFFSEKQPQLNLSLFHNPRHIRDAMNYLSKSSKPPEKNSSPCDVEFHPLLHSTNPITSDPATKLSSIADSRQRCVSIENSSCAARSKGDKITSLRGKVNGVDLDINLSVTSNNHQTVGSNAPSENPKSESAKDSSKKKGSAPREVGNKLDARDLPLDAFRNKGNAKITDNIRDESLSEIVMEQEELSDSDEEFGENVEFEHEEMADSGDDSSDSEQVVNISNEEGQLDDMDGDADLQPLQTDRDSGRNTRAPSDGWLIGSQFTDDGVNVKPNVLSLNLNSHPPVSPLPNPTNDATYDFGLFGTIGQDKSHACSKRSSRRKRAKDGPDQPSVGPGERKPRKRACRTTPNSSIAGSGKVRSITDMDLNVDNSKNVEID